MTTRHIQIDIIEPCYKSWKEMQPGCKGRFCNVCQKVVVDFATMTDTAIIDYLAEHRNQSICGRVRESQTNRPLVYERKQRQTRFSIVGVLGRIAALMVLAPGNAVLAQTLKQHKVATHASVSRSGKQTSPSHHNILRGRLVNKQVGTPAIGVPISAMGKIALTNSKGYFQFIIPGNYKEDTIAINGPAISLEEGGFSFEKVKIASIKARAGISVKIYGEEYPGIPSPVELVTMGVMVAETPEDTVDFPHPILLPLGPQKDTAR